MDDSKEQGNDSNIEKPMDNSTEKQNIVNIIDNLKPETILEYCCGIYRFQLINGQLHLPNWKIKALGILFIVIYIPIFFWFLLLPDPFDNIEMYRAVYLMDTIPTLVVLFQYIAAVISASFVIGSMNIRMVTLLAEVDAMLQVEKCVEFYKKMSFRLNRHLIILIISQTINGVFDLCSISDVQWGAVVLPLYFIQKLEIFTFCTYVIMVDWRLMIINGYLKEFVKEQAKNVLPIFTVRDTKKQTETVNFIGHPSGSNTKIRDLATTYDNLGEICSLTNNVFNFQNFLSLVSGFTYIVTTIWVSLLFYRTPGYSNSRQLVNVMVWCFNTICNIITMSYTCESLLVKRNETRILVNKIIMNYDLPKTMRVQAKAFMELVEAWPLRIYVYDMFTIDIKLMLKFISVATTYLIVIIQISHFV